MTDYWTILECLSKHLHPSQVKAVSGNLRYCAGCQSKATCDRFYSVIKTDETPPGDEKLKRVRTEVLAMASSMVHVLRVRILALNERKGDYGRVKRP